MKTIKRALLLTVAMLFLFAAPSMALEIGDPMPNPWKMTDLTLDHLGDWPTNPDNPAEEWELGGHSYIFYNADLEPVYFATSRVCDGEELYPMGVYDRRADTLYLDIDPFDGKIDMIISELSKKDRNEARVSTHMMKCPPE